MEIIDSVNKDVLRGFKTLQKNKTILYTSANKNTLASINDKTVIVYQNSNEIDFEGTFRLTRNKLIPVDEKLNSNSENYIDESAYTKLKTFYNDMVTFQKYCYSNNIWVNIAEINNTIEKLFAVYDSFTIYKHNNNSELLIAFTNNIHKTFIITKLLK